MSEGEGPTHSSSLYYSSAQHSVTKHSIAKHLATFDKTIINYEMNAESFFFAGIYEERSAKKPLLENTSI